MKTILVALVLLGLAVPVSAEQLCASSTGALRVRSECARSETRVDRSAVESVPLRNWTAASRATDGLASVASDPPTKMTNLDPCRLIDSRPGLPSAFVGDDIGSFADLEVRTYEVEDLCGIPDRAKAISINLAIVPGAESGFASVGPGESISPLPPGPEFASINYQGGGPAISNALIVPLSGGGEIDVYVARSADVIIDTNGYFMEPDPTSGNMIVLPGTGTPTENGDTLIAAMTTLSSGAVGSSWSIQLGPGVFDTGTTQLAPSRRASIRGASEELTTLTCDCELGFITGSSVGLELFDLKIENTTTNAVGNAPALTLSSSDDHLLRDVTVSTTGGSGIFVTGGDARIESVTVSSERHAVFVSSAGTVRVRDSYLTNTTFVTPVVTSNVSEVIIENSTLERLDNGGTVSTALGPTSIDIRHSRLITSSGVYASGITGDLTIAHTYIDAASSTFAGTMACSATTEPSGFTATGCP